MMNNMHGIDHKTKESAEYTLSVLRDAGLTALEVREYVLGAVTSTGDESYDAELQVDFSKIQGRGYRIRGHEWTGLNRESIESRCHYAAACHVSGELSRMYSATQEELDSAARRAVNDMLPVDPAVYDQPDGDSAVHVYEETTPRGRAIAASHRDRVHSAKSLLASLSPQLRGVMTGSRMREEIDRNPEIRPIGKAMSDGLLSENEVRAAIQAANQSA